MIDPAIDKAALSALAPGIGITRNPAAPTCITRRAPGSEIPGVPASDK